MSRRNASEVPAKTGGPRRNPLPTGHYGRRRVAGSHAGAAPGSVGEFLTVSRPQTPAGLRSRTRLVATFCLWLQLLLLPLALLAAEPVTVQVADGIGRRATRLGWYVHSGQWLADVRTVRAACQYLLADERETDARS